MTLAATTTPRRRRDAWPACARRVLPLLAALSSLVLSSSAQAHGPAPAVLGVLSLSGQAPDGLDVGDPARPDALRTNVGLLFSRPAGDYRYACPSQWADSATALAVAAPDRSLIAVLARGAVYTSRDGGCAFGQVSDPSQWYVHTIHRDADGRVWTLAREVVEGAWGDAVVLRLDPDDALREVHRWSGAEAFVPDDLSSWRQGDARGLIVTGVRPAPAAHVAEVDDAGAASDWRALDVPQPASISRLSVRAVADAGEVWLQATGSVERSLWQGVPDVDAPTTADAFADGRPLVWTEHAPSGVIHGPVAVDGRWLVALDGVAWSQPVWDGASPAAEPAWSEHEAVDWTCLQAVGDVVYACTLPALLEVTSLDDVAGTRRVFTFEQLGGPSDACPPDPDAHSLCELDWIHYAGESGWVGREPATHPDGDAGPSPDPTSDVVSGDVDASDAPDVSGGPDASADVASSGEDVATLEGGAGGDGGGDGCGCRVTRAPSTAPWWPLCLAAFVAIGWWRRRARS